MWDEVRRSGVLLVLDNLMKRKKSDEVYQSPDTEKSKVENERCYDRDLGW